MGGFPSVHHLVQPLGRVQLYPQHSGNPGSNVLLCQKVLRQGDGFLSQGAAAKLFFLHPFFQGLLHLVQRLIQQLSGGGNKAFCGQSGVAVLQIVGEGVLQPRQQPFLAVQRQAEGFGHGITGEKGHPKPGITSQVGIFLQQSHRHLPIGFKQAHRLGGIDSIGSEKKQQALHSEHLPELLQKPIQLLLRNPLDFQKPLRLLIHYQQSVVSKVFYQLPGQFGANALNHPTGQILFDGFGGAGKGAGTQFHFKLLPVYRVLGEPSPKGDLLSLRDPRHLPHSAD